MENFDEELGGALRAARRAFVISKGRELWSSLEKFAEGATYLVMLWTLLAINLMPRLDLDTEAPGIRGDVGLIILFAITYILTKLLIKITFVLLSCNKSQNRPRYILKLVGGFILFFILTPFIISILTSILYDAYLKIVLEVLSRYIHTNLAATISLMAVFLSFFVYMVRCRARLFYGISESIFGIASVLWSTRWLLTLGPQSDDWESNSQLIAQASFQVVASIYVIIRGLNNMEEGLKQRAELFVRVNSEIPRLNDILCGQLYLIWRKVF